MGEDSGEYYLTEYKYRCGRGRIGPAELLKLEDGGIGSCVAPCCVDCGETTPASASPVMRMKQRRRRVPQRKEDGRRRPACPRRAEKVAREDGLAEALERTEGTGEAVEASRAKDGGGWNPSCCG